ncbi:MAG: tRNA lysidine(34) synthetase TilS, partial [Clostridia bacterium]|nr:tRNA lysidine(34) synthetase TilS [Clostridia bacterium]
SRGLGDVYKRQVSGGADSVCLLKVLKDLSETYNLTLTAVHVHHGLRGVEADEDEAFVKSLCNEWAIPFRAYHEDVKKQSDELGLSLEEAGRQARYRIFHEVLEELGAQAVAVAHHSDDQAETVMMNILRGAGIDGLRGMEPKQGEVIRPLLGVTRHQILAYLEAEGIPFRTDSSNLSVEYTRNRVRNKLFPELKTEFSIDPVEALLRLSRNARDDADYLERDAGKAFEQILVRLEPESITLSLSGLKSGHQAIVKRIIRLTWEKLRKSRKNLESNHVDSVLKLIYDGRTGSMADLPGGFLAKRSYDELIFQKKQPFKKQSFNYNVSLTGETYIEEIGGILKAEILEGHDALATYGVPEKIKESSTRQFFDFSKVESGINIRSRCEGDKIRPTRGSGEKKLKDYFIDQKVPASKRDKLPLIAKGEDIVWVIGMRTSEKYKATTDTKKILVLTWQDHHDGGVQQW